MQRSAAAPPRPIIVYEKGNVAMASINPIQLQKYLKGVDYPASKADLVKKATQQGADEDARTALNDLPDETFDTPAAVSKALGHES